MKRASQKKSIDNQIASFFKSNPSIKKALEVFGISHDQYLKTLEGGVYFYTDTSTVPPKVRVSK